MIFVDWRKFDLWDGVISTFQLFEDGAYGSKLGISPLGSGLFTPDSLGILADCKLDNKSLLKVIGSLTQFENDQRQLVEVNYSDLDVEEFGSVYEGLLEYDARFAESNGQPSFEFVEGTGRSVSGSHYTPEELVKPLIKHSLEYIIEDKLKEPDKEKALLSITVCDVACGSGHILLSAARRIALELAIVRTNEEQPSPSAIRHAIRDVIKSCIYGVDKNPLAVELCKVAFWLEAHNPGEPLNFLDHHVKCGDSIVGLAHIEELKNGIPNEAFKALPGDEKEIASAFSKRNKKERETAGQISLDFDAAVKTKMARVIEELIQFNQLPERTPEEIREKAEAYARLVNNRNWQKIRELANLLVAQFFIPKTKQNKDCLVTDAYYREYLNGTKGIPGQAIGKSEAVAHERNFFHWFLEFPEVFSQGGFDCILGNPPFLGGKKISGFYGNDYLTFIKTKYYPSHGGLDLVTYFFRRIFDILDKNGFQSLISTNTIAQGDSRIGGLEFIINNGGRIIFAIRSMNWPGLAAVEVSLIIIVKSKIFNRVFLSNKQVDFINSHLENDINTVNPYTLLSSSSLGFMGSNILGTGFILSKEEAQGLLQENNNNKIIFPFLVADDINNSVDQQPQRFIINFFDWPEEKCKDEFPTCYEIVKKLVKPEREKVKRDTYRRNWWLYAEKGISLYRAIEKLDRYLVVPFTTKYLSFVFKEGKIVISHAAGAVAFNSYDGFALLNNSFHEYWAWKQSSTMGGSTLRYTPSSALGTYPFPRNRSVVQKNILKGIGKTYYEHRQRQMTKSQLGLTKTYNLFHYKILRPITDIELVLEEKQFEKQFGKDVLQLKKHLAKMQNPISVQEAVEGILKLRQLHMEMDQAVLESYGWSDIQLKHDFYEVDYLPENDRVRYTIHPDARREVLKRLLELNHQIHEEEVKAGLWEKKDSSKKKNKKYLSSSSESGSAQEPEERYGGLFGVNE